MSKPLFHVVLFSGGKNSAAMLLMMLEKKMPIGIFLFCNTGLEFPAMYEHISKIEKYINSPFGICLDKIIATNIVRNHA